MLKHAAKSQRAVNEEQSASQTEIKLKNNVWRSVRSAKLKENRKSHYKIWV